MSTLPENVNREFAIRVVAYYMKVCRGKNPPKGLKAEKALWGRACSTVLADLERRSRYPSDNGAAYHRLALEAEKCIGLQLDQLIHQTVVLIQQYRDKLSSPPRQGTLPSTRPRELRQALDRAWKDICRRADASLSRDVGGQWALQCLLELRLERKIDEAFEKWQPTARRQAQITRSSSAGPPATQPKPAYCWDTAPHAVRTAGDDDVTRPLPPAKKAPPHAAPQPHGQLKLW